MNPKHVDVRAYDSYLIEPDEDNIITIGVWGLYRLRLNMYAYAEQARISDFKHHLVFLNKIITRDVFKAYLMAWYFFLNGRFAGDFQKARRLKEIIMQYAEKYKEAGND